MATPAAPVKPWHPVSNGRTLRIPIRGMALGALGLAVAVAAAGYAHLLRAATADTGRTAGHVYYGLAQTLESHGFPHPLLKSADFYKKLLDDLTGVVLTPVGFGLLLLAFCRRLRREYVVWGLSAIVCIVVMPRKFFEMNYYWMAVLPLLCILVGLGVGQVWSWLGAGASGQPRRRAIGWFCATASLWLVFSVRYSVVPAFVTPREDWAVPEAAAALRRLSGPSDRVVTMHGTSLDLLYHADRRGWTLPLRGGKKGGDDETVRRLEEMIARGARWLVIVGGEETVGASPAFADYLSGVSVAAGGEGYRIYRLDEDGAFHAPYR